MLSLTVYYGCYAASWNWKKIREKGNNLDSFTVCCKSFEVEKFRGCKTNTGKHLLLDSSLV